MERNRLIRKIMKRLDDGDYIAECNTRTDLARATIKETLDAYEEFNMPLKIKAERNKARIAIFKRMKECALNNDCNCIKKCLKDLEAT